MKSARVFVFLLTAASLILAACGNATTTASSPSPTAPLPSGAGSLSPTPVLSAVEGSTPALLSSPMGTPTPTSTVTPVPCNPSAAGFCIVGGTFLLRRPIAAPGTYTADRGYTYGSTEGGTREPHHGVEFYNASGTPVLATADGTVYYAGDDINKLFAPWSNFYGNLIVLKHELPGAPYGTLYTLYAHLSKVEVTAGQTVAAGQKIGEVGASGSARGSHLHFEVRLDPQDYASTLDPELWLITITDTGVLSMRFVNEDGQFVQAQPNVQEYPNPDGTFVQAWQPEAYDPELLNKNTWGNVTLGNLPAGRYRVTYLWAGVLSERWVEIQPGKLTRVIFVVK